jgi:hypothetical protein
MSLRSHNDVRVNAVRSDLDVIKTVQLKRYMHVYMFRSAIRNTFNFAVQLILSINFTPEDGCDYARCLRVTSAHCILASTITCNLLL